MAILRSTQVQGKLEVIDNDLYVTGSGKLIHGNLAGTASVAEGLDPTKDIVIGSTEATHSLTVNGDLKVTGDVVYTGTQNLRVKDKNIELNVDDKGNAASDRTGADGAGITVKATSANGQNEDVKFYYDPTAGETGAWKSNVPFGVTIEGSVANAEYATTAGTASTANKVANKLISGSGIKSFEFDGSAEATVLVDDTYIQRIKVNAATNADNATTAGTASKTVGKLTAAGDYIKLTDTGGQPVTEFDGSKDVAVKVDLTIVEEVVTGIDDKVDNNKRLTDTALLTLEGELNKKVVGINPGSAINVTGTTTTPTVSVKLAETQGNVQLDVTDGLKASLNADAALSTTSENPVQNKVVTEKINALWEKQFPISVTASATGNTYEFDGNEHTVTVNWTAINGTASAVSISDGTTSKPAGSGKNGSVTFTKSSQGTTTYTVTATIDGKTYTANASANAWLPQFAGTSTAATVADLNVVGLAIKQRSIKGESGITVKAPTGGDKYVWFCVPSGTTISKVTSAGFGTNLKTVETKKATIGGNEYSYNCYRGVGLQTTAMTYVIS